MNTPTPRLVPVSTVAAEVGVDTDTLAARLAADVIIDADRVRCLPSDLTQRLIDDHRAAVQARRERRAAQEAELRRRPNPLLERVRALQRAQERFEGSDLPALAVMTAGDLETRLESSGRHMDELLTGESHYHSLTGKEPQ